MAADAEADVISSILSSLKSNQRLGREKGLSELKKLIDTTGEAPLPDLKELQSSLLVILSTEGGGWEGKHGALLATKLLIDEKKTNEEFKDNLKGLVGSLLEHNESRIRLLTGGNYWPCVYHVTIT